MDTRRFPVGPLIATGALLVLALHAWLARFAHPMADDFTYALRDASHGVWAALQWEHDHWNGRYASNPAMLFGPMRLGLEAIGLYRMVPVLLMALTLLATYAAVRATGPRELPRSTAAFAALLWTLLFMHATPALGEAFYWYTGAVTYQLANILCLVHMAFVVRLWRDGDHRPSLVAACISGFVVVGFNEVMMVLLLLLHGALLLVRWRSGAGVPGWMWSTLAAVAVGAGLMATAPGNAVRASFFPLQHRLFPSVGMSLLQTGRFLVIWTSSPVFIGLAGLLLLHRSRIGVLLPWTMRLADHRHLLAALPVAVLFCCTFPAYWSTGILGQYRTVNVACFFSLPLLLAAVLAWGSRPPILRWTERLRSPLIIPALGLLVFAGFFVDRNGERALGDLIHERAERSNVQLSARYALLDDCSPTGITELPTIQDAPTSLYVLDIRTDPSFLANMDYALWFGCDSVRPSGPAH